jgi:hypothetical protein
VKIFEDHKHSAAGFKVDFHPISNSCRCRNTAAQLTNETQRKVYARWFFLSEDVATRSICEVRNSFRLLYKDVSNADWFIWMRNLVTTSEGKTHIESIRFLGVSRGLRSYLWSSGLSPYSMVSMHQPDYTKS